MWAPLIHAVHLICYSGFLEANISATNVWIITEEKENSSKWQQFYENKLNSNSTSDSKDQSQPIGSEIDSYLIDFIFIAGNQDHFGN